MLMVAMLALSGTAYASASQQGCESSGGRAAGCTTNNGGDGGDALALQGQGQAQGQLQGQAQGQLQGQAQSATSVAVAGAAAGAAVVDSGNSSVRNSGNSIQGQQQGNVNVVGVQGSQQSQSIAEGAVQNTVTSNNTNTATGGQGGEGGTAVSAAVVSEGAVQNSNDYSYSYREVRQAPAIGQGSFAISGCSVAGNAGASSPGGAGFLGFGWTPPQCYDFMLAQAYQSIGEKKAVCDILKNSKAGKRQAKRGITLPECLPEVVAVPVPERVVEKVVEKVYVEVPPAKISE
jgi:hypothetical protein